MRQHALSNFNEFYCWKEPHRKWFYREKLGLGKTFFFCKEHSTWNELCSGITIITATNRFHFTLSATLLNDAHTVAILTMWIQWIVLMSHPSFGTHRTIHCSGHTFYLIYVQRIRMRAMYISAPYKKHTEST